MISRYNITMDAGLHDWAVKHAKSEFYTDFSGLLTQLLRGEKKRCEGAAPAPEPPAVKVVRKKTKP